MSSDALLSIIVPVYNVEPYLEKCITSILNQLYQNIEVILVNDGSTDQSSNICKYYADKDHRIIFIDKIENEGLVKTRQLALNIATGDYIGFVDSDDYIESDMFQSLMIHTSEYDVDIVIGGHQELLNETVIDVMLNDHPIGFYDQQAILNQIIPKLLYNGTFGGYGIFTYLWNKIFKKSIIQNNLLSIDRNISLGEDAACTYSSIIDANSIYISSCTSYKYRQRPGSMIKSTAFDKIQYSKYILLYQHLKNKFKHHISYKTLINQLQYFLLSLITTRCLKNDELFGFSNLTNEKKIALIGAGTFGQNLYRNILNNEHYSLVGWYDEYWTEYRKIGLDVNNINNLSHNYDVIVVGYINGDYANKTKTHLINQYNIAENKILVPDHYKYHSPNILLQQLGIPI
jgi:glycosyltransferase involved in cell wall biosynthesis